MRICPPSDCTPQILSNSLKLFWSPYPVKDIHNQNTILQNMILNNNSRFPNISVISLSLTNNMQIFQTWVVFNIWFKHSLINQYWPEWNRHPLRTHQRANPLFIFYFSNDLWYQFWWRETSIQLIGPNSSKSIHTTYIRTPVL